jgi:hypothetical protein
MAARKTTCRCTLEACGHPNGGPCGKEIESSQTVTHTDGDFRLVGESYPYDICDECYERARAKA